MEICKSVTFDILSCYWYHLFTSSAIKIQLHQLFSLLSTEHAMQNVDCMCKAVKWDRPQSFHQGIPCSYPAPQGDSLFRCALKIPVEFFSATEKKNINLYRQYHWYISARGNNNNNNNSLNNSL